MKKPVLLIAVGVVLAAGLAWYLARPGSGAAVDLLNEFPHALEKRPAPETFSVGDVTIGGVTKPALKPDGPSRTAWTVTVPDRAELQVSLGMMEQGWNTPGDGVLFRITVNSDELLSLVVNPSGNPGDKAWRDVSLDLSEYAGKQVTIYFATNSSMPQQPPVDNRDGDFPAWGAPRIVVR
ncbi:MAG TPA: hypothetical protein VFV98_11845 [Vicinamibacterales bacterium]|nr:hypothetical protein [Vicinamibacterales bacterium]